MARSGLCVGRFLRHILAPVFVAAGVGMGQTTSPGAGATCGRPIVVILFPDPLR